MIPVALIVFFGLMALSILALVLLRSASLDHEDTRARLLQPGAETLAYDVPDGQDPAEVIVALNRAGYKALEDGDAYQVLVQCPHGRGNDRPRVRSAIEQAGASGGIGTRRTRPRRAVRGRAVNRRRH